MPSQAGRIPCWVLAVIDTSVSLHSRRSLMLCATQVLEEWLLVHNLAVPKMQPDSPAAVLPDHCRHWHLP